MPQYLSEIKSRVDLLVTAGCPTEIEDIIYYTLNDLPPSYQAFKVAIHTNLQPVSLDDFYSLLCSEETLKIDWRHLNYKIQRYLQLTMKEDPNLPFGALIVDDQMPLGDKVRTQMLFWSVKFAANEGIPPQTAGIG